MPPQPEHKPEKTFFQIMYTKYDQGDLTFREGRPTSDINEATEIAVNLLRRNDVREVFLCTVHSAFTKEINIKKVI